MKKSVLILILFVFCFTITGCNSSKKNNAYGCDGCVYLHSKNTIKIGDQLSDYKSNYESLKNDVFLGYKIDKNGKVTAGYICGKEKKKVFCIEGNVDNTKYEENKKILSEVYKEDECQEDKYNESTLYSCSGDNSVSLSDNGFNYIGISKSNQCYANKNGETYCY